MSVEIEHGYDARVPAGFKRVETPVTPFQESVLQAIAVQTDVMRAQVIALDRIGRVLEALRAAR